MAGFIQREKNAEADSIEQWTIASLTLAVGDLLELDKGATAATVADTSTLYWQRKGVVTEPTVSGTDTLVKVIVVNQDQVWEVTSQNNSNVTHNGDRMILKDRNEVNNTGTDDENKEACVVQINAVGATADKRILVKFFGCTGVNPDAT